MAVFKDTQQMYEVLGGLFTGLMENEEVIEKMLKANIVIRFVIDNPSGEIWLDPKFGGGVICGPADISADVTMTLSGDTCHNFWLKKISLPVAIAKRKIKTRGPLPKVLKLLPLLGPAHEAYPDIAKKHGLPV